MVDVGVGVDVTTTDVPGPIEVRAGVAYVG